MTKKLKETEPLVKMKVLIFKKGMQKSDETLKLSFLLNVFAQPLPQIQAQMERMDLPQMEDSEIKPILEQGVFSEHRHGGQKFCLD